MVNNKRHTITAALPYVNSPVHIGHLAGCHLPADTYSRYLRACGEDVLFLCGSDEHGVAIMLKAMQEGISPQESCCHIVYDNKYGYKNYPESNR